MSTLEITLVGSESSTIAVNPNLAAQVIDLGVAVGPQGPAGPTGASAYQIWLAQGNTGTETDFLNAISSKLAGRSVVAPSLAAGDALVYTGSNWINENQTLLTDGGNF